MNSLLLRSALRQRQSAMSAPLMMMTTRGGGFHKPDPVPYETIKNTRRVHLED